MMNSYKQILLRIVNASKTMLPVFIVVVSTGMSSRLQAASFTIANGQVVTATQRLNNDNDTGTVEVGGTISTTVHIAASIMAIGNDVNITNNGTLSTTGGSANGIESHGTKVSITSSGMLSTTGGGSVGIHSSGDDAHITNSGSISTTGGGGAAYGIQSIGANVNITNSGSISTMSAHGIHTSGADADITNSGTISTTGAAYGIRSINTNVLRITNSGIISTTGSGHGIFSGSNADTYITNSGTISTTGAAYGIWSNGTNARITSSGTLSTSGNTAYGIILGGADAHITHSGTLSTMGDDADGILSTGANNIITNTGSITVTGLTAIGVSLDDSGADNNTLTNSGTISATGSATQAIVGSTGSNTVNLQTGSQITGNIALNNGNDVLTVQGNSTISGNIDMGGGTDAINVNAGILTLNGTISNSDTNVNTGGTLAGNATTANLLVNGGTVAPGNSIGTINTGDINFSGGGKYDVEVNAAGASDLINVTGTATLTNGVVNVQPEAGNYATSTDYTILTATNPLVGTFASVNSNLAFLTPTLSYVGNDVKLNLKRNSTSFASVANTPNQIAISTVVGNNTLAFQTITNNLLTLTNSGAQQAFDSLSGVQHTQSSVLINKLTQQFQQLLFNHSSQSANGGVAFNNFNPMQGHLLADNTNNWQTVDTDTSSLITNSRGWWMQGFGGFGDIDSSTNASGADYQSGGVAFGVDTDWRDFIVGVAGSYAHSNVDPFAGESDIDSFQTGAYASWERNNIYLNASVGLGLHQVDATRTVTVGTLVNTASADYDSVNVSTAIEAGKDMKLDFDSTLTPYVGVAYSHNTRDDFNETGAGSANLSVNEHDDDSLRTTIGLRLSKDIKTKHNKTITPSAMIAYVREHMDSVSRMEAAFSAVPTSSFRIDGSDLDRDRIQVGAGIIGQLNENTTLNVGYNGEWAGSDDHHSFAATVNFVW